MKKGFQSQREVRVIGIQQWFQSVVSSTFALVFVSFQSVNMQNKKKMKSSNIKSS